MAKLLVTGGAGYVGSHTVHHLIESGTPVSNIVVFDNLERGHAKVVPPGVELVRGDLRNEEDVSAVFRQHEIESVLHFAAYAYVGESMQEPEKYLRNNVIGGLNLLQAVRRTRMPAVCIFLDLRGVRNSSPTPHHRRLLDGS